MSSHRLWIVSSIPVPPPSSRRILSGVTSNTLNYLPRGVFCMCVRQVSQLSVLAFVVISCTVFATAQNAASWNYYGKTGPLGWGKLDPSYKACSNGREQSPLDIHGTHLNKDFKPL